MHTLSSPKRMRFSCLRRALSSAHSEPVSTRVPKGGTPNNIWILIKARKGDIRNNVEHFGVSVWQTKAGTKHQALGATTQRALTSYKRKPRLHQSTASVGGSSPSISGARYLVGVEEQVQHLQLSDCRKQMLAAAERAKGAVQVGCSGRTVACQRFLPAPPPPRGPSRDRSLSTPRGRPCAASRSRALDHDRARRAGVSETTQRQS